MNRIAAVKDWLARALRDPVSLDPSSVRVMQWSFAAAGIVSAFWHPEHAEVCYALLAAATGTAFSRTRATGPTGDPPTQGGG